MDSLNPPFLLSKLYNKLKYKFDWEIKKKVVDIILQKRLKNKDFAIVSNNCWGGGVYQVLRLPYNTPFVGLYINAPCYIKLLKNFEFYLNCELEFTNASRYGQHQSKKYPVGFLNNEVEIHFLHYKSEKEAFEKWNRRKKKLPKDINSIFFKFDDRDHCTPELIKDFHALPYKNLISFTKTKYNYQNNFKLKDPADLILFDTTHNLVDIVEWLNMKQATTGSAIFKSLRFIGYPKKFN
ncbi:DUF1919 domain-containing protein [Pontibacter ruber]|uniref:DUF1919 domain-containing protein n=1 Tax=Pontibacter ruber TaxID=1343895 RepID=A0ABW5CQZ1_9BACT|nr:DUF1919 domain-containing protein [Pontibacter ruber]